jgi:UDP-N-acetylmuramoyl-L-alanyl-D-glutamate--2,6-diaminopimelate ligase
MTTIGEVVDRLSQMGILRQGIDSSDSSAIAQRAVTEISADSRQIVPGALFCAIAGTAGDGHHFLASVGAAGAVAATVEQPDHAVALPQIEVTDGRLAAAYAAAEVFGDPWDDLVTVGVTGTNGKTTTVAILRHLLTTRGPTASVGTLGTVGAAGTVLPGTEGLTTPGPIELARLLRRLADDGAWAVAMETSSHALHQSRVAAARFDAGIFSNLSRDHLDYHGTIEAYRDAKLRLLDLLKPAGAAVVNADDPAWRDVTAIGRRTIRFGMEKAADVRAEEVSAGIGGTRWVLRMPDGAARVLLPLYGAYNVANALGAAAALWSLGWPADEIAAGLESLPQIPGRLERVPTPAGSAGVVVDYAHTPDALERALAALRPLVTGRLIVVFGAGGDRDRGKRPEMGRVAAAGADVCIVTSDNPRTEDPERIADDIERGMGHAPRLRVLDRREAIARALEEGRAGDLILLAGKGHETYQIRGVEMYPFDERVVVREILAEKGVRV